MKSDNRALALTVERSCIEHEFDGFRQSCSDCRRATSGAKAELLKVRNLPAPKFDWWYDRPAHGRQHVYLDRHYAYGSCGGFRDSHDKGAKYLGDCDTCWRARLENWIAAQQVDRAS